MSFVNLLITRNISTSAVRLGKKNFKKFPLYTKRGSRVFKQRRWEKPETVPKSLEDRGIKDVGYWEGQKLVVIPEKVPELIVPDLTNFQLKPYVSYRTPKVIQSEFTAEDLFNVIYAPKIAKDFKENTLNDDGSPKEPSAEEKLTPEEAKIKAQQTGTDLFSF